MALRLCLTHLNMLDGDISKKGMHHMCTNVEAEIKRKAELWLAGQLPKEDFDPRIAAVLEIKAKCIDMLGEHDGCPLCAVGKAFGQNADKSWSDNVTDLMLLTAKTNGLHTRTTH